MSYYDGTKLLSLKDINGNIPEIYICTSNRSAGKTTYFNRLCVNRFLKNAEKFALIYRYNYELDDIVDKFFKDIQSLFFLNHNMTAKKRAKGIYQELFIDDIPCGYAISLNSADSLKKYSHLFSDVSRMIFDEFQSETNHYCTEELRKFQSVHKSIARGQGKMVRRVPVYMLSNPVTILNPYYVAFGISTRLREDTVFLRGDGFVCEQGFNQDAHDAQIDSGFNRAFSPDRYQSYSNEGIYLNDSKSFLDKPIGKSRYLCTLKYKGKEYAVREYAEHGIIYADDRVDSTFPFRLVVTVNDHDINYVMLKRNDVFISSLRYFFEKGCFRFKDLECKDAILTVLSY